QHQVGWALERLCELSGARWVYDSDPLQEIRRDVMTILTHHAASRPAAFAPYGHMLLAHGGEWPGCRKGCQRQRNAELPRRKRRHGCRSGRIWLSLSPPIAE